MKFCVARSGLKPGRAPLFFGAKPTARQASPHCERCGKPRCGFTGLTRRAFSHAVHGVGRIVQLDRRAFQRPWGPPIRSKGVETPWAIFAVNGVAMCSDVWGEAVGIYGTVNGGAIRPFVGSDPVFTTTAIDG